MRVLLERRAVNLANRAFFARQKVLNLEKVLAKRPDDPLLQRGLAKAKQQLAVFDAVARAAAGRAGLLIKAVEEAARKPEKIPERVLIGLEVILNKTNEVMDNFTKNIKKSLENVSSVFKVAAVLWIDSFVESWKANEVAIRNTIANTFREAKKEFEKGLDFTANNSPSIEDIFKSNTDVVQRGVRDINRAFATAPGLNLGALTSPRTPSIGAAGFQRGATTQTLNDNRSVTMDISSNVDLDDLKRQIGLAVGDSGMSAGQV